VDREESIQQILGEWRLARERGIAASPEDVIRQHPELAERLLESFEVMRALDRLLARGAAETVPGRISEYDIEREIGRGGMGTVYLANSPRGRVALKLIHPHLVDREGFLRRFRREAEIGSRIVHDNVVRVLGAESLEIDGRSIRFLVMEYVEGRTLRLLQEDLGVVPEALVREIAQQAASGLEAIHAAGIVHRDLKPENLLITDDHRVRIMDLGVARVVAGAETLTREGQFAGTLHYAAPEQFRRGKVGPAADLYSLGLVLYELSTGENPFRGDDPAAVMRAHLEVTPPRASKRRAEISSFFSEVLAALLEKAPGERIGSAAALREVLEDEKRGAWWAERQLVVLREGSRIPRVSVRRETALYGRATELKTLRQIWRQARDGEGNTILVEGEAGVGKTRLVDAFLDGLGDEGAHVLYGSYPPSGGLGGLSDALLGHFDSENLEAAIAPHLAATPSLVPAFAALLRHQSPPAGAAEITGESHSAVFGQLMRGLAAERPLLWVVEDLHFADANSRRIVLSLARALEGKRVLLLLTTRPDLPDGELSQLSRLTGFRRMPLPRLSPREVVRLLRDAFRSEALAEKLGVKIAYKSDGVPFFVFEMIRGLKEGQFIEELPDGSYVESRVIREIEVPSAVRDLIGVRLADLTVEDRNLLDVAAVVGFEFDPDLVARTLGRPRVVVLQALADIERRSGVVLSVGRQCRFDHHQIQEVVYGELSQALREEYHSLVAEAFAEREAADSAGVPRENAVVLADHYLRGREPEGALPFLEPALDHLRRSLRNDAALKMADRALSIGERLPLPAHKAALRAKLESLRDQGRREEQCAVLEEAADLAETSGDRDLRMMVHWHRGNYLYDTDRFAEAVGQFETTLRLAREAGARKIEAHAAGTLGSVLGDLGRHDEAREHLELQLEIGRETGDRITEVRARTNLGGLLNRLGALDEARVHFERCWILSREVGFQRGSVLATGNLGVLAFSQGRIGEALGYCEQQRDAAREIGDKYVLTVALVNVGNHRVLLGDPEGAYDVLLAALSTSRETRSRLMEVHALHGIAALEFARSRIGEALHRAEAALTLSREIAQPAMEADSLLLRGSLRREAGDDDAARGDFAAALDIAAESTLPYAVVFALSHLAAITGEASEALRVFEKERQHLDLTESMEARFLLWQATGDRQHLEDAHQSLSYLRDHAPEKYRETMVKNVPLHRDIMAAWEEYRGNS